MEEQAPRLINPFEPQGGPFAALLVRDLGDGRAIWLHPQLFGYRISIGILDSDSFDDLWEYLDLRRATFAFAEWNPAIQPEPQSWVRHPKSGRRRFPDGDPATEIVRE